MMYAFYEEIPYQNPLRIFHYFASRNGSAFLDSSRLMKGCGRFSYIGIDPFYIFNVKKSQSNPFAELKKQLKKYPMNFYLKMPPFQGGVMGYLSYELSHYLEDLPVIADDLQFPDLVLGFYDLVIAFDHELKRAWIFSSGYPEQEKISREIRAKKRCAWLQNLLNEVDVLPSLSKAVCAAENIQSNFSEPQYENAVKKVIDYILAGDIFEANIAQRFQTTLPSDLSPFELYRRLRLINPAPFSAYLNFSDNVIASASPERFLKLTGNTVETRPIKGTRPRGKNAEEDKHFSNALLQSEKDRAENVMIVDLLRNDLSRVCEDHSVQVPQLCGLESYATVHHLVSVVKGTLKENQDVIDLLCATFPGGSITGAPKIRAMEIISEMEGMQRGPYCGSIVYIGFNGDMDSSITIRTFAIKNNIVTFQAGGAVVADSDPSTEYHETLIKADALHKALTRVPEEDDIVD